MNELTKWIETNHVLAIAGPLVWISFWIAASVVYRRSRGKTIFPSKPKDSLYYEGSASGHSNSSILTKLGGARNCLLVAVTADSLVIQLRFPFNLMFLPEIFGLEYKITGLNIRSVQKTGRFFWKGVEVRFIDPSGSEKSVTLHLKKPDQFIDAIAKASTIVESKRNL
jgi:hypothetical protein